MFKSIANTTKGFGTMSMTWTATPQPFEKSIETLNYVREKYGVKLFNCSDFYHIDPEFQNLKLIAQFCKQLDDCSDITISIKTCFKAGVSDGSKAFVDESIKRDLEYFKDLKTKPKFIFEAARVDPNTPVEDTVRFIYEHVKSGQINGVSLSEVSADSIRKAAAVVPIEFIEVELSLLTTDIFDNGVLEEASKHQIPILAYSPLGRGMLTDHAAAHEDYISSLPDSDFKKQAFDRFKPDIYAKNKKRIDALYAFSQAKGIKLEALALSWIESISGLKDFCGIPKVCTAIPIPSGSTKQKIDSNFNTVKLSRAEVDEIQKILDTYPVVGGRYNEVMDQSLNG